ncbi:MAG TPA: hypothetical protein EYH06_03950 [Chromatiales bacterium]|nr:hypothetical protein [Thiotrichales bacterium]HIP67726.1 hypothetical protein [Chromatiales bacterium]
MDDSVKYAESYGDDSKEEQQDNEIKPSKKRTMTLDESTLFLVYERLARKKIGRTDEDWKDLQTYFKKLEKKAGGNHG